MRTFRLLIEGHDVTGSFLVTCIVRADSLELARAIVVEKSALAGWTIAAWDETEDLGAADVGSHPGIASQTGRAYFDVPGAPGEN